MKTQTRINIKSVTILTALLFTFCVSLCFGAVKMTAYADVGDFTIDAQLLSSNDETFDISVTIENTGDDWEGVARLKVEGGYSAYTDCAYDTAVSLPQGSVKQFVVKVPKYSYSYNTTNINGNIGIFLIDRNSKHVFSKEFDKLLFDRKDALNMGILSDDYASLTFMDMGGDKINYYGGSYPIKLVELNQDNLTDLLESLEFLVIDNYDTGVLTAEETAAIEKWNNGGGVLIVGSGKYADDTLAGLDYLNVEHIEMFDAGDLTYDEDSWIDADEVEIAALGISDPSYYSDDYIHALLTDKGDGAIGVLHYSLTELGKAGSDAYNQFYISQSDFVYEVLNNISSNASRRYDSPIASNYNVGYIGGRFLSALGNGGNSLSFGALKIIIVIYVILAGPVLYLVLRFLKKRDLYWVTVPVLSLAGIMVVMFAGRGFEVARIRVYSVAVCDLSKYADCMTYMHCYDAGHNEWQLRLSQGYEFASSTSTYTLADDIAYDYRILKEGERLFFGTDPETGFEDAYFYAGKKMDMQNMGGIECNAPLYIYNKEINRIANNTEYDFEYLAVLDKDYLWVYKGLAAGETCNPAKMKEIFKINVDSYYYYDYMSEAQKALKTDNVDIIAALGMGINSAYYRLGTDEMAVIGVTSDYAKAVDDNCNEESYGCFYIIQ
ncbi:MAG: hypothetical protein NC313_08945 [Butyrivibrio sp.]|nr:hypothetical protein [Butyrivibrio sp.]